MVTSNASRSSSQRALLLLLLAATAACAESIAEPGGTTAAAAETASAAGATDEADDGEADDAEGGGMSMEDLLRIMSPAEADPAVPRGVTVHEDGALEGFTLIAPLNSTTVYLIDMEGGIAHSWPTDSSPGACNYLLDDGTLLRAGREDRDPKFKGGGIGGRVQKLAPDGTVLWHYPFAEADRQQHHDLAPLPGGNVLLIAWERKSREEAIARGAHPESVGAPGFWPDAVYEVRPTPPSDGEIVWEWHAWDHLVQDVDPRKPNHGAIAEHPGRIDVNAGWVPPDQVSEEERREQEELEAQMAALGYAGGEEDEVHADDKEEEDAPPRHETTGDWLHTNSVDYHAELDLVVLSTPELCELWVIDHSTTTAEAATSSGGRRGRGGDLLWRWGNPVMHGAGTKDDQRLFYQHNPTWLFGSDDLRLLVFNNGGGRADDAKYSSVEELVLPFDSEHGFAHRSGSAFGPAQPSWSYSAPETFFSAFISGAQRLANGNTLICSGASGRVFEITPDKRIVWEFRNPLGGEVEPPDHAGNAPPLALFRATRYAADHAGVRALLAHASPSSK
jgi:hypothetical protein